MKAETIVNKIMNGVNTAIGEIEELRLQLALGKLEAKDLYETNKKKFNIFLQDLENEFKELKEDKNMLPLKSAIDHLRLQLALGKAESKVVFEEQYEKIKTALHKLENELKNETYLSENYARLHLELEKFKIKLDLLGLHFKLKKVSVEYNFEKKKNELISTLNSIKDKIAAKEKEGKQKWEHFREEIGDAYEHLRSAFKS